MNPQIIIFFILFVFLIYFYMIRSTVIADPFVNRDSGTKGVHWSESRLERYYDVESGDILGDRWGRI